MHGNALRAMLACSVMTAKLQSNDMHKHNSEPLDKLRRHRGVQQRRTTVLAQQARWCGADARRTDGVGIGEAGSRGRVKV